MTNKNEDVAMLTVSKWNGPTQIRIELSKAFAHMVYGNQEVKNGNFGKNGYLVNNFGGVWGYVANSGHLAHTQTQITKHTIGNLYAHLMSLTSFPVEDTDHHFFVFSELRNW